MAHLTFRVSNDLAGRFAAVASVRGGKSRLLRALVEAVTKSPPGERDLGLGARGASKKVTVRLKDEDLATLDVVSKQAGMRRTEWVTACVRRRLLDKPQFNREQAEALLEARRELRRISVQLRELVRAVREGDVPVEALEPTIAEVEVFQRDVRAQLQGVRAALEGEAAYWGSAA